MGSDRVDIARAADYPVVDIVVKPEPRPMLELFYHPFSSYSQKALIAFYENDISFSGRVLGDGDAGAAMHALWPLDRFPVLRADDRTIVESTAILDYVDLHHRGPTRFVPDDPDEALDVRMRDRIFDNYVMTPVQTIVADALRPADRRDPHGVEAARAMLDKTYAWLDGEMATREWAAGDRFGLADCAAAPSLFYADWTHPIGDRRPHLAAYRRRLNARPAFARCIEGGRPYRHLFPLGAPDRD